MLPSIIMKHLDAPVPPEKLPARCDEQGFIELACQLAVGPAIPIATQLE